MFIGNVICIVHVCIKPTLLHWEGGELGMLTSLGEPLTTRPTLLLVLESGWKYLIGYTTTMVCYN